jgi:hypothetical protein
MSTAEEPSTDFYAMADYSTLAMFANRGDRLNRALETIERVSCASGNQLEGLVVFIATDFAFCHLTPHLGAALSLAHEALLYIGGECPLNAG